VSGPDEGLLSPAAVANAAAVLAPAPIVPVVDRRSLRGSKAKAREGETYYYGGAQDPGAVDAADAAAAHVGSASYCSPRHRKRISSRDEG
jgi:hypothetical protein